MNQALKLLKDIKELGEAAFMDGASYFTVLTRIYVPLSMACLANLTLFCTIGHQYAWFDGLIYMKDPLDYHLQTYFVYR